MSEAEPPTEEPIAQVAVPSVSGAAIRGARLAGIGYAGSQALTFGAYLALVRLISPSGFGLYAAGTVVTGIGGLFAQSGMLAALINRRDRIDEAASTAFFALLLSGCLLTLLSLALSPLLGLAFNRSEVALVTAVMSGWLLLRALTIVPDALLQREFSFARRAVVDPLGSLTFAVTAIPLASIGAGVWALVAGAYASMIVQAVSAWWFVPFRPRWREASVSLWREMAGFARPVLIAEALLRISLQIDAVMLGRFRGAAPLGQYRNGLRLAEQPAGAFISVMAYVLLPAFARIGHIPERTAAAARQVYWVAMTVIVPVSLASVPLGVPLAVIFLGARWRPAGHAIAGLGGLVLGTAIVSIASELLKAVGRPGVLVGVEVVGFGLIAVTVSVSAALWGVVGVAVAMSVSSCGTAAYALVRLSSVLNLRLGELALGFVGPLIAAGAMIPAMLICGAQLHTLQHSKPIQVLAFITEVLAGLLVYCSVLGLVDPPRRREARRLLRTRLRARHQTPAAQG